jgi:hypothetical protein
MCVSNGIPSTFTVPLFPGGWDGLAGAALDAVPNGVLSVKANTATIRPLTTDAGGPARART